MSIIPVVWYFLSTKKLLENEFNDKSKMVPQSDKLKWSEHEPKFSTYEKHRFDKNRSILFYLLLRLLTVHVHVFVFIWPKNTVEMYYTICIWELMWT